MKENFSLTKYYSAHNWESFVSGVRQRADPNVLELGSRVSALGIPEDIALGLAEIFRDDDAIRWVHSSIPALENERPIDIVSSREGIKALKVCIMRLPA
jgi:Antitoxin Xre/MbcA/ParS C-terminal toxin-binding domain